MSDLNDSDVVYYKRRKKIAIISDDEDETPPNNENISNKSEQIHKKSCPDLSDVSIIDISSPSSLERKIQDYKESSKEGWLVETSSMKNKTSNDECIICESDQSSQGDKIDLVTNGVKHMNSVANYVSENYEKMDKNNKTKTHINDTSVLTKLDDSNQTHSITKNDENFETREESIIYESDQSLQGDEIDMVASVDKDISSDMSSFASYTSENDESDEKEEMVKSNKIKSIVIDTSAFTKPNNESDHSDNKTGNESLASDFEDDNSGVVFSASEEGENGGIVKSNKSKSIVIDTSPITKRCSSIINNVSFNAQPISRSTLLPNQIGNNVLPEERPSKKFYPGHTENEMKKTIDIASESVVIDSSEDDDSNDVSNYEGTIECTSGDEDDSVEVEDTEILSGFKPVDNERQYDVNKKDRKPYSVPASLPAGPSKVLTVDALANLQQCLATTPDVKMMEEPPDGLTSELMAHQRQALAWLIHRESQSPAGGILADDMGLGKTLTIIALILKTKEMKKTSESEPMKSGLRFDGCGPGHPGKTLIVCPASLLGQWEGQVKEHVRRGKLITKLHHGSNREGRGRELTGADMVITTYGVLAQENKCKGALFRVAWERVVLDEAHTIRNHKTKMALAASEIIAKRRWCLTGTPIQNKELDMYSMLKFLKCEPFDDLSVWKHWVDNKSAAGLQRLNAVVSAILLRRTKEELKTNLKGNITNKEVHVIRVELDKYEIEVYESVMKFSKTLLAQYLQQRSEAADGGALQIGTIQSLQNRLKNVDEIKTHEILLLLLRLRQICCLPSLINAMLEEDDAAINGMDDSGEKLDNLFRQVGRLSIGHAPSPEEDERLKKVLVTSNPVFDVNRPSSKIQRILQLVSSIVEMGDKIVIVSQWATLLRHIEDHLKSKGLRFFKLDGSVAVKFRGKLVEDFNDPTNKISIFLLTLTAGGVGLNLVGGNHLILVEPHWNPQLEAQACDRVYRMGQTKNVHIYKLLCKDTIEERIEKLQQKKIDLANAVLQGNLRAKNMFKPSLNDLKMLFGLPGS